MKSLILPGLILVLIIVGTVYALFDVGFSVQALETTILELRGWGVAGSIGLMVLHTFVPFPAEFLTIANGMVYGPVWGAVISWVGAMLGAALAFALVRWLGRPFAEKMIARKDWHKFDAWISEQGFSFVLISRFVPIIAFNLVNYLAGLTAISWGKFLLATGIGILPVLIILVLFGYHIEHITWPLWVLFAIAAVLMWFVFRGRLQQFRPPDDGTTIPPGNPKNIDRQDRSK
ncbi:MAG TPA: TVP38/TMEM64 family protein [Gammaproteobacteria bacterium]|nr:TVP38/TMEM64 family protein [Gammaproteobacteria bacterium]